MANIIDYIEWRGDLTFRQSPFNYVDNLIFATLSYADFRGIVPGISEEDGITVADAMTLYEEKGNWVADHNSSTYLGERVLVAMADSKRYSHIKLSKFTDEVDEKLQMQFSAMRCTIQDDIFYIAFRGTDDFLIGWKEDFALSFEEVEAQKRASEYLESIIDKNYRYIIGGHSKGGNLAVYAGMSCSEQCRERIEAIYCNDGPGICSDMAEFGRLELIEDKIVRIIPEFSIIGMLFNNGSNIIVKSDAKGLLQHNPYSWQVSRSGFKIADKLDKRAELYNSAIDKWIGTATLEQRRIFTEDLFNVLGAGGAKMTTQLWESVERLDSIFKALMDTAPESKKMVRNLFGVFSGVFRGKQ